MSVTAPLVHHIRVDRDLVLLGIAVLTAEAIAVTGYLLLAPATVNDPLILLYPFIWINVGLLAVITTRPTPTSTNRRLIALGIGTAYFAVLAVASGMVGPGAAFRHHSTATGLQIAVTSLPPGWGPALTYGGEYATVAILPYEFIGYVALTYLVYVTVLDAAGAAASGLLALFSCVSCAWPIVGTLIASVFGGTAGITVVVTGQAYGISTVVFISAIALLYWRPLGPSRPSR